MGKVNVRVDIPKNPDEMIDLGEDIGERHIELGTSSPLNNKVDMNSFADMLQFAKDKRKEAIDAHSFGEATIQEAEIALGRESNQTIGTPDTIYYYTGRIRSQLQLTYQGKEEQMSTFGFNVIIGTTGKKRNVSIDIPIDNHPDMEKLAAKIIERHNELGANSPLNNAEVSNMETQLQLTIAKRKEGNKYHEQAEAAMQISNKALGLDKGQTIYTEGTIYYTINRIRKILLLAYQGVEEEISTFGFNVVISEAGTGGVPTPPLAPTETITLATKENPLVPISISMMGADGENVLFKWNDGTADNTIIVNSTTFVVAMHLYTTINNYTIQIIGAVAAFMALLAPDCQLTAINIPNTINLHRIDLNNNLLVSFFLPASCTDLIDIQLNNNELDQQSVNALLIMIESFGTSNGTISIVGGSNAAPSGQGLAAKNQLIARGWTVVTN